MIKFLKYNMLALAVSVGLTGCIDDRGDCPAVDSATEGSYVLRLSVAAGEASTSRAAGHSLEAAEKAENLINLSDGDYAIVLFDEDGNYLTEVPAPLVMYEGDGIYWVESEIENSTLKGVDNFQVMVIANGKSYDSSLTLKNKIDGTATTAMLWSNGTDYNFNHQATAGSEAWTPNKEAKRLIPMFGLKSVEKSDFAKDLNGVNRAMIDIPMLRALAKIQVVDKTPAGYKITNVTLSSYNTSGRLIPNIAMGSGNENWSVDETQITTPSVPSNANEAKGTNLTFSKLTNENGTVWTAYVAEDQFPVTTTLTNDRPHLNVTVESDEGHVYTYTVHFAQYASDGTVTIPSGAPGWHRLLRNHIYRYEVKTASVTTDLSLEVLPWETTDDEIWFYEEIPGSVDPIAWDNFAAKNEQKATVTLNVSQEEEKILCGTFQISAPLSGIWHAQLMTMGNALPTAMTFCNADGSSIDSADGIVDKDSGYCYHIWGPIGVRTADGTSFEEPEEPAKIYIKVTNTGKEQESQFKLLIVVQNGDNWMEMNLTPSDVDDGVNYWTIIRPTTDYESGD